MLVHVECSLKAQLCYKYFYTACFYSSYTVEALPSTTFRVSDWPINQKNLTYSATKMDQVLC